jgi:hypothetical protein
MLGAAASVVALLVVADDSVSPAQPDSAAVVIRPRGSSNVFMRTCATPGSFVGAITG